MNMDYSSPQMPRADQTEATTRRLDPLETVLEATARLRVLERLLQHALAAETSTERRFQLLRYNRQRRELLERLAAAPSDRHNLSRERTDAAITGPLPQDSSDLAINAAMDNTRRLIEQLVIS